MAVLSNVPYIWHDDADGENESYDRFCAFELVLVNLFIIKLSERVGAKESNEFGEKYG